MRILCRAAGAALTLFLAGGTARAQAAGAPEYDLKAAFVFNFAVFTQWPQEALGGAAALTLCAYPGNTLLPALIALNDKLINGRRLSVRPLGASAAPHGCQILVLDSADRERWSHIRKELAGASVLTIADDPVIGNDGSAISLGFDGLRIGFDVDLNAARLAHLSLSAKLLRLARNVR